MMSDASGREGVKQNLMISDEGPREGGAQWGIELILGPFVDHLGNFEIGG